MIGEGGGDVGARRRSCAPVPHVALHTLHAPHTPTVQSAAHGAALQLRSTAARAASASAGTAPLDLGVKCGDTGPRRGLRPVPGLSQSRNPIFTVLRPCFPEATLLLLIHPFLFLRPRRAALHQNPTTPSAPQPRAHTITRPR